MQSGLKGKRKGHGVSGRALRVLLKFRAEGGTTSPTTSRSAPVPVPFAKSLVPSNLRSVAVRPPPHHITNVLQLQYGQSREEQQDSLTSYWGNGVVVRRNECTKR